MAKTTGPILALGTITFLNQSVFHDKPMDWKLPIATGVAAGFFGLLEKTSEKAAVSLAYAALVTILLTRVNGVPSPTESFLSWWNTNDKSVSSKSPSQGGTTRSV
jgi:hypothetical protein